MFLILTSNPEPGGDRAARGLAGVLAGRSRTVVASVHPSMMEFAPRPLPGGNGAAGKPVEAPPVWGAGPAPEAVFAVGPEAVKPLLDTPFRDVPLVVLLRGGRAAGELSDLLHRASEIWLLSKAARAPRDLRKRCVRVPAKAFKDGKWVGRRLGPLLSRRGRRAPRYPLTSLVIPVHNALSELKTCVASIRRNTPEPHELILVDNGSNAAVRRYLRSLRGARVITNRENRGFARAINQGMRAARGRYIAWVNSDLVLTPDWLKGMLDCAQADDSIGAVGPFTNRTVGAQVVPAPNIPEMNIAALEIFAAAWAQKHARQRQQVHRLVGFLLLTKRHVVDKVGQLDERFGLGTYEDFDYCLRIRQAGFKLSIAKDVFVFHHEHKSFKSTPDFLETAMRNRDLFIEKWCRKALEFWDSIDPALAFFPSKK